MIRLRRLGYVALVLAYVQVVFGAVVRITGSGMGCGDDWPRCLGRWFPPLDRPDLIIEYTHRVVALALLLAAVALLIAAWHGRRGPGVGGPGGVLRAAGLAVGLWVVPAILGAVTVWLELPPLVVVAHLVVAMALLGVLAVAVLRAGGFGARDVASATVSPRTRRAALAAAAVAFAVVLLGGLTANVPGAAPACQGFPLCNGGIVPRGGLQQLHFGHRVLAYLLALHVAALAIGAARRREPRVVVRAARTALAAVALQIAIAAVLVETFLPPALQSLHQAVGTLVWVSLLVLAWLATSARQLGARELGTAPAAELPSAERRAPGYRGASP